MTNRGPAPPKTEDLTMTTDIDAILARREDLKRRDPDAILLFRATIEGHDLYITFDDDIQPLMKASDESTGRLWVPRYGNQWAGVSPEHLEAVLARIVAAGKRAAVCEQVSPAEAAKVRKAEKAGKVKVERVVTEGRIKEPESWKVHDADDCPVVQVRDASGEVVCDIIEGDYSTRLARAAKIAAAPDLLAACRKALVPMKEAWAQQTEGEDLWPVCEAIRIAIAKAAGPD